MRKLTLRQWPGWSVLKGQVSSQAGSSFPDSLGSCATAGGCGAWFVLVWIKKFRVVQLRELLGLAADVLQ